MKKCWKQVMMFVLVAVAALWIGRTDAKAATIVETGSCGDNATYTLDSDGLLTISGSGEIKDWAFYNRNDIKKVVIQKKITSIGDYAFEGCRNITSITIPDSVSSIGWHAFGGCGALEKVKVSTDNPVYDSRNNCNAIIETSTNSLICGCQSTTIPNSVTSIGKGAFGECSNLTSITIPDSVTSIGEERLGNVVI